MDANVRIGGVTVSALTGVTLSCVGLGSCIGLAVYDLHRGVVGLAHVMLPQAPSDRPPNAGRYADLAVPALIDLIQAEGAVKHRLEAVLAGGAAMFGLDGPQDIGARNVVAVRRALSALGVPVRAEAVGGSRGRTIRISVSPTMTTVVREAGGRDLLIFGGPGGRGG